MSRLTGGITSSAAGIFLLFACWARGQQAGDILWSIGLGNFATVEASAAIAPDGTLYVTTGDAHLDALTPNGHRKWSFPTGSDSVSSPAVGDDGTIYLGSRDRRFYAVTPEGKQKWSFRAGGWIDSSPALALDGTIYFGCWDKKFYALDAAGHKKWEFATGGPIDSSPAIGADGTIYFGSHDRKFYALNPDGTRKWSFETGGAIISSPAIGADGTLYISSVDGNLHAISPSGTRKWQLHTGGVRSSSPALDENGALYLGVNNAIWAVNPDGTKRERNWAYSVDDEQHDLFIDSSPAIAGGLVVFGTDAGLLFGFSIETGAPQWATQLGSAVKAGPTIAEDGTVYIGAHSARMYAVRGGKGLAHSAWPKFRADLRQTGRVAK